MAVRSFSCFFLASTISVVCSVAPGHAEEFYPFFRITSSTADTDFYPVSNLILGPGVGIDADEPHDKLLSGQEGNWVTDAPGGFPADYIQVAGMPVLVLDMGEDVALAEISVWGYASSNANGVSAFRLRFATDDDGEDFGSSITYEPTFEELLNDDLMRQSFPFGRTVTARYVEFTAEDNFYISPGDGSGGETPGGDRVGLGEIAFAVSEPPPPGTHFLRGDCTSEGEINISDAVCILNWLFAGEVTPGCVAATNTNGDDAANITDATYLLNHLFAGGPAPVAPYPDCGPGMLPADKELGCANPPDCQ